MSGSVMQFPVRFGIDEGVDPKNAPPGTLLTGENIWPDKLGRARKRYGTAGLAKTLMNGASTIINAERLITRGDDIGVFDATSIYEYSAQVARWQTIDRPPNWRARRRNLIDSTRSATAADVAVYQDLLISAWMAGDSVTGAPIYVQIEDVSTVSPGPRPLPPTLLVASGMFPRVVVTGAYAYVFWTTSSGHLERAQINLATMAISTSALYTNAAASSMFDVHVNGTTVYLAYELASGTNRLRVQRFDASNPASWGAAAATKDTGSDTFVAICIYGTPGEYCFVTWNTSATGTELETLAASTLASVIGPTVINGSVANNVFVARYSATHFLFGYAPVTSSGAAPERLVTFVGNASTHVTASNTTRTTFGIGFPSKPFLSNGRWYCSAVVFVHPNSVTSTDSIPEASSVLIEIRTDEYAAAVAPHLHVATLEHLTGWYSRTNAGHITQPAINSAGAVYLAAACRNREPLNYEAIPLGFHVWKLERNVGDLSRPLSVLGAAFGVAGAPWWFDGATSMPAGFIHAPIIAAIGAGAGGSGSMAAGVYQYIVVYEWRDANGLLHRSIPSPAKSVTAAASGSVTLTIQSASICGKQTETTGFGTSSASPVMLAVYRTTVGGAVFYRLTHEPNYQVAFNDPTAATVALSDTKADSNIASGSPAAVLSAQPQLYTVQETEDVPPPGFETAIIHRGRIFGIAGDLRTLWASKDVGEDQTVAPGFHESMTLAFEEDKFALASFDDKLAVFGESSIDIVVGGGPDANGQQNDWQVIGVQTDHGCVNARSLVDMPLGVMFEGTDQKIQLLTRGLEVVWVGEPIQDLLETYPTITSAVLVPRYHQVRFTANNVAGTAGVVLVFDYHRKAWFSYRYYDTSLDSFAVYRDAALIDGVYTFVTPAGKVWQEDPTTCLDDGTRFVDQDCVFAPISPSGNLAWHRVRAVQILGTSVEDHALTISVARDYATSYEQTKTFAAGSVVTAAGPLEKAQITLANQKLQAVKIRVKDATPNTPVSGGGFILEGVALHIEPKAGLPKASSDRKG